MANRTGVGQLVIDVKVRTGNAASQVNRLSKAFTGLKRSVIGMRRGLSEIRYGMQNILSVVRPAAFAGTIAAFLGLREAVNFDQEVHNLAGVLGGLAKVTPRVRKELRGLALDPANNATLVEGTKAFTGMARSAVVESERFAAASVALKLASIDSDMSVTAISKQLPKMVNMFGTSFAYTGDVLARASDMIPGNVSDIFTGMQYAGPAAQEMGMNINEGMALLMTGIRRLKPSIAGTTFRQFSSVFAKEKKTKALSKLLGFDIFEGGEIKDFGKTFTKIGQAFKNMSGEDRLKTAYGLFGLRGKAQVVALGDELEKTGSSWDELVAKTSAGISLTEKAEIVMQGLGKQLKFIRSALGVIAVDFFGGIFSGASMDGFTKSVGKVAEAFGMLRANKNAKLETMQVAGGARMFSQEQIDVARGLRDAVDGIREAFEKIGEIFTKIFGGSDGGARTIANLVGQFVVFAPVALTVAFALSSVMNVARGLLLILSGLGRVIWASVLKPMWAMTKATWKWLGVQRQQMRASKGLGSMWDSMGNQLTGYNMKARKLVRHNLKMHGSLKGLALTAGQLANRGLAAIGRGFLSILGPMALAGAAFAAIDAVIGKMGDHTADLREELNRLRSGKEVMPELVEADVDKAVRLLTMARNPELVIPDITRRGAPSGLKQRARGKFAKRQPLESVAPTYADLRRANPSMAMSDLARLRALRGGATAEQLKAAENIDPLIRGPGGAMSTTQADFLASGADVSSKDIDMLKMIGAMGFKPGDAAKVRGMIIEFQRVAEWGGRIRKAGMGLPDLFRTMGISEEVINQFVARLGASGENVNQIALDMKNLSGKFNAGIKAIIMTERVTEESNRAVGGFKVGLDTTRKALDLVNQALAMQALQTAFAAAGVQVDATSAGAAKGVKKGMKGEPCIEVPVSLGIGGRKVAEVVARANLDLTERGGAKVKAWQKHRVLHDGAIAVT